MLNSYKSVPIMPENSPAILLKKVLNNISNTQSLLNSSIKLAETLESVDFEDFTEDSNEIIEKTRTIMDELKEKITSLDKYLSKHYNNWKNKESCRNNDGKESSENDIRTCDGHLVVDDSFCTDSEIVNSNRLHNEIIASDSSIDENLDMLNTEDALQNSTETIDKVNLDEAENDDSRSVLNGNLVTNDDRLQDDTGNAIDRGVYEDIQNDDSSSEQTRENNKISEENSTQNVIHEKHKDEITNNDTEKCEKANVCNKKKSNENDDSSSEQTRENDKISEENSTHNVIHEKNQDDITNNDIEKCEKANVCNKKKSNENDDSSSKQTRENDKISEENSTQNMIHEKNQDEITNNDNEKCEKANVCNKKKSNENDDSSSKQTGEKDKINEENSTQNVEHKKNKDEITNNDTTKCEKEIVCNKRKSNKNMTNNKRSFKDIAEVDRQDKVCVPSTEKNGEEINEITTNELENRSMDVAHVTINDETEDDPLSTNSLENNSDEVADPLGADSNNSRDSTNHTAESNPNISKVDCNTSVKQELSFKIKCVDIKTLLEPGVQPIVVISDSENESFLKKKGKSNNTALRKNKKANSKKKVIVLDDSDSDAPITKLSKNNALTIIKCPSKKEVLRSRSDRSGRRLRTKRKVTEDLINVSSLSENSTSNSDEDISVVTKSKTLKKQKGKKTTYSTSDRSILNAQKDKKFSWKAYVPLTRVPARVLLKNYEKRKTRMEIKRLTNMESLKKSRKKRSHSSDSASSTSPKTKRAGNKRKRTKKANAQNESSSDDSDVNPLPPKTVEEMFDEMVDDSNTDPKKDEADIAEVILNTINSDSDNANVNTISDSGSKSSDDEKSKEKSEKESKKKEKKSKGSDAENAAKCSDAEKQNTDSGEDDDAEAKKRKKKWRKDKLLIGKISESDSDEDFAKFMEKKDKIDENKSDTEEITIKKPKKRLTKRKAKNVLGSDSDSSAAKSQSSSSEQKSESSSSEESEQETTKKKATRKRIKKLQDSSDDEQDEDKSTRKNIRKVWKKKALSETTIAAEKEEEERKERIAEKQKKYNLIFDANSLQKATVDKVVLDFDEETKKELLKVDKRIVKHLKPHQAQGIQFMWNACFESLKRAKETKGSGCILAHCMGLGKTLQVIALIHTLLKKTEKTGVRKVLIVCPLSTVLNWVAEFKLWLPDEDEVEIFELVSFKQNTERMYQVKEWDRIGGALVMGYDMFRNLTNPNSNKRLSKKLRNTFETCLVNPGPDLVICDEGHLLKNEKTSLSIAMNRLASMRRIVLTGTPLQNNLREYFCMLQFVKPNLLGTYKEYLNRFVNPITNGQYTDSTLHDIQIMRKRSHVLHKLLDGVVERRDYSVLAPFLPPKHEYVLFVSLTEMQIKLYQHYMKERAGPQNNEGRGRAYLFNDFNEFQRICTHPRVLMDKSNDVKEKNKKGFLDDESEGSLKDFIDDGDDKTSNESSSSSGSGSEGDSDDSGKKKKDDKAPPQRKRLTRAMAATYEISDTEITPEDDQPDPSEWWKQYCQDDDLDNIANSSKLSLLFEILKECELIGDKILIFSQSLYSLNVIEYFLNKIDEATQNSETNSFCGYSGSWSLGLDYFRLDGSSSCDNRAAWCKTFNNPDNIRARLFLISTRAGGLGINLVAANRVIIFDVSWNPSHDTQSIYRVYRFGQNKPSYIYRFVTQGTMEMKIYERQVTKQAISKRVIDEQQIDRHYNQSDLAELYNFEPVPKEERSIPLVPKDVLLGELLQMDAKIYKYHEHQSLLENKVDEVLDEEERKAAWEEFENEKKARTYSGSINNVPVQSIVIALRSIISKENPSWDSKIVSVEASRRFNTLQEELETGNSPLFQMCLKEISVMQAAQRQSMEQYYRVIRQQQELMQQYRQQMLAGQGNPYGNNSGMNRMQQTQNYPRQAIPNLVRFANASGANVNPIDYIDLND